MFIILNLLKILGILYLVSSVQEMDTITNTIQEVVMEADFKKSRFFITLIVCILDAHVFQQKV